MLRMIVGTGSIATLILLSGTVVRPVAAGGIVPYPVASEWTQIGNNIELGGINLQTLNSLAEDIQQTRLQIQQAKTIDTQLYSQVYNDITNVSQAVRVGQALAYNMSDLDAQWNNKYGPDGYKDPNNYGSQYQTWAQTTMDSTRGTLNATTLQGQKFDGDAQMVESLQQMAKGSVQGSLQAEQAMLQILAQQLGEQQKLRQLILADLTAKEAYQAQQLQQSEIGQSLGQIGSLDTLTIPVDTSVSFPDDYLSAIGQNR